MRLLAACCAAALATAATAYEPTGELRFRVRGAVGTGASFDDGRLVGPTANLTRQEGGGWAGDLAGQNVSLEVSPTRLSGANVDLHLSKEGAKQVVRGLFFGQRIWLEIAEKKVSGRIGGCSFDLGRKRTGLYEGTVGCVDRERTLPATAHASLTMFGDAARAEPPQPQFALALVAVLAG